MYHSDSANQLDSDGLNTTTIATKAVVDEIHVTTNLTERTVQELNARHISDQQHQKRQILAQWLTPLDYAAKQQEVISDCQPETGQNLLESVEDQAWCGAKHQSLMCPGIPGAGKTMLTAIVIEYLEIKHQSDNSIGLAYIYSNYQTPLELGDIYSSILKHVLLYHCQDLDNIVEWCKEFQARRSHPSSSETKQFLHKIMGQFSTFFIVIDALDECNSKEGRDELLEEVTDLYEKDNINLFVISRPDPASLSTFQGCVRREISAVEDVCLI